jgi:hypothetical protein
MLDKEYSIRVAFLRWLLLRINLLALWNLSKTSFLSSLNTYGWGEMDVSLILRNAYLSGFIGEEETQLTKSTYKEIVQPYTDTNSQVTEYQIESRFGRLAMQRFTYPVTRHTQDFAFMG